MYTIYMSFEKAPTDSIRPSIPRKALVFDTVVVQGTLNKNVGVAGIIHENRRRVCAEVEETGEHAAFMRVPSNVDFVYSESTTDRITHEGVQIEPLETFVKTSCPMLSLLRCAQCPSRFK